MCGLALAFERGETQFFLFSKPPERGNIHLNEKIDYEISLDTEIHIWRVTVLWLFYCLL